MEEPVTNRQCAAEETATSGQCAAEETEDPQVRNIFDSVFHTIVQNLPHLLIALINLSFGTDYPKNAEILPLHEEHHHKSGQINTDCYLRIGKMMYHIECQTNPDGTMALRMVEYDFMIALEEAWTRKADTLRLPSSCVVYLRHHKNTPDEHRLTILGDGGQSMEYLCRVIKVQNYTLDEIFEKNLLMFLPFYIMRYERQFPGMEEDEPLRVRFLREVEELTDRLQRAASQEEQAGVYQDLVALITDIAEYELKMYRKTLEGVKDIMEARILPLPSDSIREAKREGRAEGRAEGREEGLTSMFNSLIRTMYEKGCSVLQIADLTDHSEEAVRNALCTQGLAV